jgi:hypothetical protein
LDDETGGEEVEVEVEVDNEMSASAADKEDRVSTIESDKSDEE